MCGDATNMDNTTEQNLALAFELIENDRLNDAVIVLEPMLERETNNADVWWLYAHAVSDPNKARNALNNVLRLDPNYPGATDLAKSLDTKYPAPAATTIKSLSPTPASSAPDILPDIEPEDDVSDLFEDDIFEDEEAVVLVGTTASRRRFLVPLAAALIVVVLVIALIIINPFKGAAPIPTATTGAQVAVATSTGELIVPPTEVTTETPTDEPIPTQEVESVPTEPEPTATETEEVVTATEVVTSEATTSPDTLDFSSLSSALSDYNVPEDGIEVMTTDLGDTLVVTVCGDRSALADVMDIVVNESVAFGDSVDGIGVSIGDCASPSTMRVIGATMNDVAAYTAGTLSMQEFKRLWRPIG
jgi:hypothetical protein